MKFLSYVECDGNQAVNTGFKPNQDTRVIMDCFLNNVATSLFGLFGARDTNSATAANQFISWVATAGEAIRSDYFGTSVTAEVIMHSKRLIVDQNRNICTADGVSAINTYKAGQCTNTMYVGAVNNVGSFGFGMYGKIYGCKIYDDNVLVRDYVPAMTDDGVVGLWDKVEEVFYQSVNKVFAAGPVKSVGMINHIFTGLENGKTYYARVFTINPKGRVNNRADLPFASAIPSAFPAEPSAYELISTYTSTTTFTAPETGYYQIDVHGSSGTGGNGDAGESGYYDDDDDWIRENYYAASGGGGGGSGFGCSRIKLYKGDTVKITIVSGGNTTVEINSTVESYPSIIVTSGGNGTSGSNYGKTAGKGGAGGVSSGGNVSNLTGNAGSNGKTNDGTSQAYASQVSGGSPAHNEGNTGGIGGRAQIGTGSNTVEQAGGAGKAGFIKIYRGDTNIVA